MPLRGAPDCDLVAAHLPDTLLSLFLPHGIRSQKSGISGVIELAGGESQNRLRRVLLARRKPIAVQLQKQDADHESRALVPVDEGMVVDNARRVDRSKVDHVRRPSISLVLLRPSQGGSQETRLPDTRGAAMQRKQAIVQHERIALVDPEGCLHLARTWSVFR